MMLKKALVFIFIVGILANITTVSAVHYGDTRIVGPYSKMLPTLNVSCGEKIDVVAKLELFGPIGFLGLYDCWTPCSLRDLDLGVSDSTGKIIHTDEARTGLITSEAHFDTFELNQPGSYVCYIKYAGNLKQCQTRFMIHVK